MPYLTIAEVGPIVIDDDEDTKTTGAASGFAEVTQKAPPPVLFKRRPMLKSPPTTRPKAVLKSAPVALTRAPRLNQQVHTRLLDEPSDHSI